SPAESEPATIPAARGGTSTPTACGARSASTTPTLEACETAAPTKAARLSTTKTPTSAQSTAPNAAAIIGSRHRNAASQKPISSTPVALLHPRLEQPLQRPLPAQGLQAPRREAPVAHHHEAIRVGQQEAESVADDRQA